MKLNEMGWCSMFKCMTIQVFIVMMIDLVQILPSGNFILV